MSKGGYLYIFLDEGGNLDFSPKGSKFFTLTGLTKERPFFAYAELCALKYDLVEQGIDLEYFHASEDRQAVRNQVFGIIKKYMDGIRIDSVIEEKSKTAVELRPVEKFYPKLMGNLIRNILTGFDLSRFSEVLIYTDSMPVEKKKQAIQKAIKEALSEMLPKDARYRIFHHASKSNCDLQIVDYCNWALFRFWEKGDNRALLEILPAVKNQF
jgi:hypothetical protein